MNRKSLKIIFWITICVGTFLFFFFDQEKTIVNYLLNVFIAGLYSFTLSIGNGFVNDYLSKKYSWVEQTKTRVILGIIATVVVNVVLVLLCNYINFIIIHKNEFSGFFNGEMGFSNWFTINIALLISAILHAKSFIEEWKKSTKNEVTEQKIIASSANAQFESLKNQLDPHFLFNSLNVLSSLIDENPNQAQNFTSSMSKVYRYVLEQKDKELVTVEEELDFAKTYCELLKTRFEDIVDFEFNVNETEKKGFVVPLSLQLLLENCIKHNLATTSKPLHIKIFSENGFLCIENNLQQRELTNDRKGIGLENIVQRYSLVTERNVFIDKTEDYFKVKIPLLTEKLNIMTINKTDELLAYEKAAKRVEELKGFYGNLISYCIFIPFLFFINYMTSPNYWWAFWPMFGWGIGVIAHGIQVFGIGRDWEERQIRKYMKQEEDLQNKWK